MELDKKAFKTFMREFLESVNEFNKLHYQYRGDLKQFTVVTLNYRVRDQF